MNALIALPNQIADVITSPEMLFTTSYNDGTQDWHVYLSTQDTTADYSGSKLICWWDSEGPVVFDNQDPPQPLPIDPDYIDYINPPGNDAGKAIAYTDIMHFAGHKPRHVQTVPVANTLPQYPADRQPYVVRVERTVVTDDGFSHIPHGFEFTIEFADPSRDPGVRTFGVYSDAECTQYLWTVGGAFVEGTDDEGNTIWTSTCPVGQRTADPQEWHFALLYASLQEGHFTLPLGTQSMVLNFFNADQGDPLPGEVIEWAVGQVVVAGDLRTYLGITYECLQGHTTQAGWTPVAVPALWAAV